MGKWKPREQAMANKNGSKQRRRQRLGRVAVTSGGAR